MADGERDFTFFYGNSSPFSNFHRAAFSWDASSCPTLRDRLPAEFVLTNPRFNCSEQAFMYAKALFFNDFFVAGQILAEQTPNGQKKLGRAVKGFDADAWATASVPIVGSILYEKFTQNPGLQRALLATGDSVIAEASPRDRIWGIGMGASNPLARDMGQWKGENRLGRLLMEVRERIRSEEVASDE